jgi:biopolymer transport protein ExbB
MKIMILIATLICSTVYAAKESEYLNLVKTYQKELIYLTSQKRNLIKQKKKIERDFAGKISKASRNAKKMQNDYVMLSTDNERLINDLSDLERGLENSQMNKELIATTLSQAQVSLGLEDSDLGLGSNEDKLKLVFTRAFAHLSKGETKTKEPDEFFLANGTKVRGDVIYWGHVARFAVYDKKSAMLMPVGEGKFKFAEESDVTATKLTLTRDPSVLKAFLYESPTKGIEVKKEQSFMEMIEAGGMIAYVILVLGIMAFALMLMRGLMLWVTGKANPEILKSLQKGQMSILKEKLKQDDSSLSRVLNKTLAHFGESTEHREHVIHEAILSELNFLDRFGALILVMAAVAPLLGLLGTVTGMISTFDIITEFGTGDPKLLSRGISEALITTKLGLMVAIPTLLVGNLFSGWSSKIKVMLEREALRLSNLSFQNVQIINEKIEISGNSQNIVTAELTSHA